MEAIEVMKGEHQRILAVLEALDAFADAAEEGRGDRLELRRFVEFLRRYADERHHGKEEHVLFQAMARNGFPPEQGPVGMMILEHQEMRDLVSTLHGLAGQDAPWSAEEAARVAGTARAYSSELREHVLKEDEMLYPMAEEHLPPPVQDEVDRECASLDRRRASSDAELEELAESLLAAGAPRAR